MENYSSYKFHFPVHLRARPDNRGRRIRVGQQISLADHKGNRSNERSARFIWTPELDIRCTHPPLNERREIAFPARTIFPSPSREREREKERYFAVNKRRNHRETSLDKSPWNSEQSTEIRSARIVPFDRVWSIVIIAGYWRFVTDIKIDQRITFTNVRIL